MNKMGLHLTLCAPHVVRTYFFATSSCINVNRPHTPPRRKTQENTFLAPIVRANKLLAVLDPGSVCALLNLNACRAPTCAELPDVAHDIACTKRHKANDSEKTCVCVCVCAFVRVSMCVCTCVCEREGWPHRDTAHTHRGYIYICVEREMD